MAENDDASALLKRTMMEPTLTYAHLCDYAGPGLNGKPILIGLFDVLFYRSDAELPVPMPLSYFAMKIEASLGRLALSTP